MHSRISEKKVITERWSEADLPTAVHVVFVVVGTVVVDNKNEVFHIQTSSTHRRSYLQTDRQTDMGICAGPIAWNRLPSSLHELTHIKTFFQTKTFLFQQAYQHKKHVAVLRPTFYVVIRLSVGNYFYVPKLLWG